MKHLKNQSLSKILQTSTLLQDYVSKTKSLKKLTYIIKQYLEPELAKNCSVASLANNELILATTSPIGKHKLRFLVPDLLEKLRKLPQLYGLANIKIIHNHNISPKYEGKENGNKIKDENPNKKTLAKNQAFKTTAISDSTSTQLITAAEHIKNKELAKALVRLAELKKKDDN